MFLAASGAAGSIQLVIQSAPLLFLFATVQLAVHFISLMGFGKLIFRLKSRELYLASNANVGGPSEFICEKICLLDMMYELYYSVTNSSYLLFFPRATVATAAAMATAKDWPRLVLPALLVGILGEKVFFTPFMGSKNLYHIISSLSYY